MSTPDRKAKAQAAAGSKGRGANAIVIGGIVAVLVIALVVGGVIWSATRDSGGSAAGEQELPQGVSEGEPIEPYKDAEPASDAPVVDVYEDFRCPACQAFEAAAGESITELAQDGEIRLRVHLKTIIDANTGGDSSAVAGSSAVCALEQDEWTAYHRALFEMQPQQETEDGFPEETYTAAAEEAGMSGQTLQEWQQCTDEQTYVDYVQSVDEASAEEGVTGTPVIEVEGTRLNWGGLTDGQDPSTFDTEEFEDILTSGSVPEDLVAQQ